MCSFSILTSYAPAATLKLHLGQYQMPDAILSNRREPHDGHRLFCFNVRYAFPYLFLTVAPNFTPKPLSPVGPCLLLLTSFRQLL